MLLSSSLRHSTPAGVSGPNQTDQCVLRTCSRPQCRIFTQPFRRARPLPIFIQRHVTPHSATGLQSTESTQLLDRLLEDIDGTDSGLDLPEEKRQRIDNTIEELEAQGRQQVPRPLDNSLVFGNYVVAYVSSRNQKGQPAGGRFRGAIGRRLFPTKALLQSVLQPNIVTNKVEFALLGLIPGFVALRGTFVSEGEGKDTVKVQFEPPVISLNNVITLRIGPSSSVVLQTTYLDERVRLGRGGRGSLFVFTRGGVADKADMDKVGLGRTKPFGWALLIGGIAALAAYAFQLWQTNSLVGRLAASTLGLVSLAISAVVFRGGIIDEHNEQ